MGLPCKFSPDHMPHFWEEKKKKKLHHHDSFGTCGLEDRTSIPVFCEVDCIILPRSYSVWETVIYSESQRWM